MRRLIFGFLLGTAAMASAAVTVSLSLPNDAFSLSRWACTRANAGATPGVCTAAEGQAWLEGRIDLVILAPIRIDQEDRSSRRDVRCELFTAAPLAAKNKACADVGLAAGCTFPGC